MTITILPVDSPLLAHYTQHWTETDVAKEEDLLDWTLVGFQTWGRLAFPVFAWEMVPPSLKEPMLISDEICTLRM